MFDLLFSDYTLLSVITLALCSFIAGFIDSVVGGGGLIQIPALLINLPNSSLPTVFGTNKIAALSGTFVAAWQYSKRVKYNYWLLLIISLCAFFAARWGAKSLYFIEASTLKPVILAILVFIAILTFTQKKIGTIQTQAISITKQIIMGSLLGIVVGIYDGFFGPGTGSFFVIGFVTLLGFDFLKATAYTKVVNCVTNLSALIVFISRGNYILELAILMTICNVAGSIWGSKMALKKGNNFIRVFFLIMVTVMIVKYGIDVLL